jgi:pyruvate carboxylase
VQRRRQKLIEIAPAMHLPAATRDALTDAALRLAGRVGFRSAGTFEFLVGSGGRHVFLECNPRVQAGGAAAEP